MAAVEVRTASEGAVGDRATLRRIQLLTLVYGVLGGSVFGWWAGWFSGVVLTLTALATIVSFRGLEVMTRLLEPREHGDLGLYNSLLILLRYTVLAGGLVAALLLGSNHFLALVLGFSALPAALMTEGLLSGLHAVREASDDD